MDIGQLLATAANLMITGMVGVFVFLSLLISAITIMSKLASRFEQPVATTPTRTPSIKASGVSSEHIAAISAAIAQYKNKQKL
ncbi:OadG family protein [Pseudoalteromonas sp. SR44-5]|uniref:Probable oxaloacetate decarboxylase gamma chain n=1 Tax=Pseudoalteromonas rhizosphaerae TaxID=2518973 RepID=A0ABW8KYD5_9GAMM|nr:MULTISPECIES: OadG family transporter subunit [unclassified Pseudoalteromonas]MBB1364827.1 OadG family protein [Pseudoalteromonas sp. SR44-5]MBB1415695.1 OadG family protein [Pseudoalteromonas sp. SG44-1]MBB1433592.1 OadG family protein [Pseudoalteromonas sp. SG43-6]MBB1468078.1 OadG family protein [Pseudoalteromonas sp. SG41-5]MBB1478227.1 OadG family protein [Pseudoalteromonas sp. SG41-2]